MTIRYDEIYVTDATRPCCFERHDFLVDLKQHRCESF